MTFELQYTDTKSNARAGLITTDHGQIQTPISVSYTHLDVYKRQHQYYESLLNKVDTVVLVTGASGHIEWMNQAAVAHLGQISQLPDVLQEASISNDMSMIRIEQNGILYLIIIR